MCHLLLLKLENCCCFDVRFGSLVLLWISLLGAIATAGVELEAGYGWGMINEVICFMLAIFGLCAIEKKEPSWLIPYLVVNIVTFFIKVALLGAIFYVALQADGQINEADILSMLFGVIVFMGFEWYFLSVIYSYYLKLKTEASASAYDAI